MTLMNLMTLGYVKRNGKTLMLHRTKKKNDIHEGKWNGLGGHMEPGETPEECIIREISEETNGGIIVKNPKLKGRIVFVDLKSGSANISHMYVFVIDDFEGEVIDESNEGDLQWIADEEIPDLNRWGGDNVYWPWIMEAKIFSAKLIYNGDDFVDHQVVFY